MSIRRGTLKNSVFRKAIDAAWAEVKTNVVSPASCSTSTAGPPSPKVKEEASSAPKSDVHKSDETGKFSAPTITLPTLPKLAALKVQNKAMVRHENTRFETVGFSHLNMRLTELAFREFPGFKDEELQQLIRKTLSVETLFFFATHYKFLPLLEFSNPEVPPRTSYANKFMLYVGRLTIQNESEAKKFVDKILIQVIQNFRHFLEKHGKDYFHPKDYKRLMERSTQYFGRCVKADAESKAQPEK
jgi:hypothetical protein